MIMNSYESRKIGMLSDIGKTREVDEDSILARQIRHIKKSKMHKACLLIVADGLGGHQKGEEASNIATNSIFKECCQELPDDTQYNLILKKGIQRANQAILDYATEYPEATGMATTSVCAIVEGNNVVLANVGDSRAYRISNDGEINRITKDHSFVQELVDQERLNKDEAREHPRKNEITKAVGLSSSLEVDTMKLTLDSDESLLLCCDGVNDHLTDDEIQKIVCDLPNPQDACQEIVDMANGKGGLDNISLIILSAEKERVGSKVHHMYKKHSGRSVEELTPDEKAFREKVESSDPPQDSIKSPSNE